VGTVSAGAKAFLDLARTLEHLETLSVPVLGWRTDELPMFWCRTSGLPLAHRVEDAATVARVVRARHALGSSGGVLVAAPIPEADALPRSAVDDAIASAVADAGTGAAATPRVLAAIAAATAGRTVAANLALAENNARIAASIARRLAET
jgi:pseudouridine-5'-phosphate glycosidase